MNKKVMMAIGAAVLAVTAQCAPVASAAQVQRVLSSSNIQEDGKFVAGPKWFADKGTAYMPVYYVMQALKSSLNIQSTWKDQRWDLTVPTDITVDLKGIKEGTGSAGICINGTLVQRVNLIYATDPASGITTTYMPVWYVMQALQRVGVISTWDNGTWNMFSNIPAKQLQAYRLKHPNDKIGFAAAASFFADDGPSLIIENDTRGGAYKPITISVISPTLTVTDITTDADYPEYVQFIPTSTGNMAAAFAGAGAHMDKLYVIRPANGTPTVLQTYSGDNGVGAWVQDGKPEVLVSNRTYTFDIKAPDGQMDDRSENTVYRFDNNIFSEINHFSQGVFSYEPQFQTDPEADTFFVLQVLSHNPGNGKQLAREIAGWKNDLYSGAFVSDLAAADIGFLKSAGPTSSWVVSTVSKTDKKATYAAAVGAHTIYFSLENSKNWQFTGLSVDVVPH